MPVCLSVLHSQLASEMDVPLIATGRNHEGQRSPTLVDQQMMINNIGDIFLQPLAAAGKIHFPTTQAEALNNVYM